MESKTSVKTRKAGSFRGPKPEILAPAGNRDSFLAALAAGADAVYCGLKEHSARAAAKNFHPAELVGLIDLAHDMGRKVYLAVNTLLKADELLPVGQQLDWLQQHSPPDAIIVQDMAAIALAKQVGFRGEIHLSTLANVTMAAVLPRLGKTLGAHRVVLPRELTVDEIKLMAAACPPDIGLELFVHGALCYGVSGRCYWSSYLGGKSGLRGRCVQPCRRRYRYQQAEKRFFSCRDFSLDVLVKVLAEIVPVRAWKIEGRKKGPHYVYYTTAAYKMLRDEGHDAQTKRSALSLLEHALGRPTTHYLFLPQRQFNPIDTESDSGSGLMVGTVRAEGSKVYIQPRQELLPTDKLRIGYEDDRWHQTLDLNKSVPKGGKFFFKTGHAKLPAKGVPVFLIDRRESYLQDQIKRLESRLPPVSEASQTPSAFHLRLQPGSPKKPRERLMHVLREPGPRIRQTSLGLWLAPKVVGLLQTGQIASAWWWLPPVIWPQEEAEWRQLIRQAQTKGAKRFVLNAPWQISLFPQPERYTLWAGPFCNIANPLAVRAFKLMGGQGVIVSPELGMTDMEALAAKSVLPLGAVISGHWPLCVSRTLVGDLKPGLPFESPKGEHGWAQRYGSLYWIFPNWPITLRVAQESLIKAGFRLFVHLEEPVPKDIRLKQRPGKWNWEIGLK
ncbi:MAG: U32 family peptidase [Desulfatitalea sp.]|nr:U32 family peptidase [Desulfatitalea sp.]NNK00549.1 U32 family peptidase [Desulfatitalea sp.]